MRFLAPFLACICAVAMVLVGCKGSSDSGEKKSGESNASGKPAALPGQATSAAAEPSSATASTGGKWEVRTDAEGRKWFGDVPYDVFFDDPLGVANDNEAVAVMSEQPDAVQPKATTTEPPDEAPMAAVGGDGWTALMSAEALDSEVKKIRNFLNPKLQSVGQYNSNLAMIPSQAATLAALSGVAALHDGDISWKADALYIRDLAGAMNAKPLQRGAKFQRELLGLYEQISDTLNRSRPSDLPEPDPETTMADVAEMGLLMKRMEQAYNEMKTKAGSEGGFAKSKEMIQEEAALLAVLTKVVTMEGYGYADDEEFIAFADAVKKNSLLMLEATASENFTEYDKALSAAYQACNQCHMDYKN